MNTTVKKSSKLAKGLSATKKGINPKFFIKGVPMPKVSKDFVNYDISPYSLEYLGFNRGADKDEEQYKRKKVDSIKEKIKNGSWMWPFAVLQAIFKNGRYRVLDGHHRAQAVKELIEEGSLPLSYTIPVHVITDPIITSMPDKELAKIVSIINDYDPRWRESEHIKTAMLFNLNAAKQLMSFKSEFDAQEIVSDGKKVKGAYNWIYALAIPNGDVFAAKHNKVTYSLLMDNVLAKTMQSEEFAEKFKGFITILKNHASNWSAYNVRLSASVGHIIKAGDMIGFDKLNNVLNRMQKPKTEKALHNFFAKAVYSATK